MNHPVPIASIIYAFVAVLLALTSPVMAQENKTQILSSAVLQTAQGNAIEYGKFKDWYLECQFSKTSQRSRCELSTDVIAEKTENQTAADISLKLIFENSDTSGIAVIQTPLELLLSKGINLEIDNRTLGKLSYRSCHTTGCLAPFSVSGGIRRAMLNGISAKLTIYDLEGKSQSGSFSLLGISSAIKHANAYHKQN